MAFEDTLASAIRSMAEYDDLVEEKGEGGDIDVVYGLANDLVGAGTNLIASAVEAFLLSTRTIFDLCTKLYNMPGAYIDRVMSGRPGHDVGGSDRQLQRALGAWAYQRNLVELLTGKIGYLPQSEQQYQDLASMLRAEIPASPEEA